VQVKVPSGLLLTWAVARAAEARRMLKVVFMVVVLSVESE
jgi:hypothetical protein